MAEDKTAVDNIFSYYKFLNPKIDWTTGGFILTRPGSSGSVKAENVDQTKELYNVYIDHITPGSKIINDDRVKSLSSNGLYFGTVTQAKDSQESSFLGGDYWKYYDQTGAAGGKQKSENVSYPNFYSSVCKSTANNATPPIDFTINVLRSPLLTCARQKTEAIEIFLNYMPSYFASNMSPYFDVEFQVRRNFDDNSPDSNFLSSPSLLRFFMGSVDISSMSLTEADKSLNMAMTTPTVVSASATSNFVGMEMFTTPQTLINMDNLTAGSGRTVDAKPFLPPATIEGASINIVNAGAGDFAHKTATITMKVHDKNRLVEFSEFIRGSGVGYSKGRVVVWLTYGWIAPRSSNSDTDIYAKFINENMLVREAYTIKNTSFTFDAAGQVAVVIELVSAAIGAFESNSLDAANPEGPNQMRKIMDDIERNLEEIRKRRYAFGAPSEGLEEVRIFQILDSATSGELEPDIEPAKLKSTLSAVKKALEDPKKTHLKGKELQDAKILIENIERLYSKETLDNYRKAVFNYISDRLRTVYDGSGVDPFLPSSAKPEYFSPNLISLVEAKQPDIQLGEFPADSRQSRYIDKEAYAGLKKNINASKKRVVSFGKLFCTFCLPSLLASCSDEGVKEVQINFYQFNESCGPLSYHNIAEFPIDILNFIIQFESYVERRGGDSMTVSQFIEFVIETQILDNRSLAYGMSDAYETIKVEEDRQEVKTKDFENKMSAWSAKYGSFKRPVIGIKTECKDINAQGSVDLLYDLAEDAGAYYSTTRKGAIKRIHIYDKSCNIYNNKARKILKDSSGRLFSVNPEDPQFVNLPKLSEEQIKTAFNEQASGNSATIQSSVSVPFDSGQNVLRDYLDSAPLNIPTIEYGSNGTTIVGASLSSRADGILSTIYMQGGSFKASSKLSPNGLSMQVNNLPMRVIPAQLTMGSLGCPIADLYQSYFIDFGTSTTLDNIYTATQVAHSFSPGKFETAWTFGYNDGYGKFYAPLGINEFVDLIKSEAEEDAPAEPKKAKPPAPAPKK